MRNLLTEEEKKKGDECSLRQFMNIADMKDRLAQVMTDKLSILGGRGSLFNPFPDIQKKASGQGASNGGAYENDQLANGDLPPTPLSHLGKSSQGSTVEDYGYSMEGRRRSRLGQP